MSNKILSLSVDESGKSTRLVRWAVFVIVVFLGGGVVWGSAAPIKGAVIAAGVVKVDNNRKSIQHLEGGIIAEILVREGENVEEGQALIVLDDTDASSNSNILADTLAALLAKESRLLAEASLAKEIEFRAASELSSSNAEKRKQEELKLFQTRRKTLFDQVEIIEDEIGHARDAVQSLSRQVDALEQNARLVKEQLTAGEKLTEAGALDKNSLLELKRKSSVAEEALWDQKARLALQRQDVQALRLRIVNLKNEYRKDAEVELKTTRDLIREVEERIRPAQDWLARKTIRSSISGQVMSLTATTIGGVVKPGESLLDIVPAERELVFEVQVRPRDADMVVIGQPALVQLTAFNQRTTPMIEAYVSYVSGDAIVDKASATRGSYYVAYIRTKPDSLKALGDQSLTPGMPVLAFVQTGSRTFFEYVLSPIASVVRQAMVDEN